MPNSTKLIFPPISARIKEVAGDKLILDMLRQRWLVLTPEEWVRQHIIAWLATEKGIPTLRICQEYPVNVNGLHQRADIVVIDNNAQPYILVECKAPNITIDNEVAMQAMRYNSVIGAKYIMLSNGLSIYLYEYANGKYRAITNLPL